MDFRHPRNGQKASTLANGFPLGKTLSTKLPRLGFHCSLGRKAHIVRPCSFSWHHRSEQLSLPDWVLSPPVLFSTALCRARQEKGAGMARGGWQREQGSRRGRLRSMGDFCNAVKGLVLPCELEAGKILSVHDTAVGAE